MSELSHEPLAPRRRRPRLGARAGYTCVLPTTPQPGYVLPAACSNKQTGTIACDTATACESGYARDYPSVSNPVGLPRMSGADTDIICLADGAELQFTAGCTGASPGMAWPYGLAFGPAAPWRRARCPPVTHAALFHDVAAPPCVHSSPCARCPADRHSGANVRHRRGSHYLRRQRTRRHLWRGAQLQRWHAQRGHGRHDVRLGLRRRLRRVLFDPDVRREWQCGGRDAHGRRDLHG